MPRGASRFLKLVVPLAALMPLIGAAAQEPAPRPAAHDLTIAQVGGGFIIRAPEQRNAPPAVLRLGRSIRLDRAIIAQRPAVSASLDIASNHNANTGGTDEAR